MFASGADVFIHRHAALSTLWFCILDRLSSDIVSVVTFFEFTDVASFVRVASCADS